MEGTDVRYDDDIIGSQAVPIHSGRDHFGY